MFRLVRSGILALAFGATLAGVMALPVAARPPVSPSADPSEVALTPLEQQARADKLAFAQKELRRPGSVIGASPAACPASAQTLTASGISPSAVSPAAGCSGYWGWVSITPRRQEQSYWCGVATVQVVSNYVWRMAASSNKWTQSQITAWTQTTTAGTSGSRESYGLNQANAGSPNLPASWTYAAMTSTQIAQGGSVWHSLLRTDINQYSMPQVVSVAPKDPGFAYFLTSWRNAAAQYAGHYIVLNGWTGVWDNTRTPTVNYADSAVGATGTASLDPAYDMWQMIRKTNVNKTGVYVGW
ncbi:MAG: C39 family peptidase [Candidatus Limnocylindrales bacterium]|jgi:hypothetical protein